MDFRRAFLPEPWRARDGQFDPVKFSKLVTSRGPSYEEWVLDETRIYAGRAVATRDRRTAAANDRQFAAWEAEGATVRSQPLRYPPDWPKTPAVQKGVDVEMAVDIVRLATLGEYDVAVVASTDTDLVPALAVVQELRIKRRGGPRVTVVGFDGLRKQLRFGDPALGNMYCFRLSPDDYVAVMDTTDYGRQ
jgi:hypothetical protein